MSDKYGNQHPGKNRTPGIPLDERDTKLLLDVLNIQSASGFDKASGTHGTTAMQLFIRRMARSYGCRVVIKDENVYVTKGKSTLYPCYVSHTDTVHDLVPDDDYKVYYDPNLFDAYFGYSPIKNEFRGVGGDDKVGIFIALVMLRDLTHVKAAFFCDEEIGCVGARRADMEFFTDCAFAIECDRRGNDDIIQNAGVELYGNDFAEAIKPAMDEFGYGNAHGMITDVKTLKTNGLGIACCNMSCGYYNPHSNKEYIIPSDVGRTLAFVKSITTLTKHQRWVHEYVKPTYVPYVTGTYSPKAWGRHNGAALDDEDSYGAWEHNGRHEMSYDPCPDCRQNLSYNNWCIRCCKHWTNAELDDADDRYNGILIPDETYLGGDNPPCIRCGGKTVEYDETVDMLFCWDCFIYFDLDGRIFPVNWDEYRDRKADEHVIVDGVYEEVISESQ